MSQSINNAKTHLVINANILGLNTAALCVVEYTGDDVFPTDIYPIARYDEMENTFIAIAKEFPSVADIEFTSDEPFDRFLEIEKHIRDNHYHNDISHVEICGTLISKHLLEKYNENVDYLEVELEELERYIKDCFHTQYAKEWQLRDNAHKSPFHQLGLDEYLKTRGF